MGNGYHSDYDWSQLEHLSKVMDLPQLRPLAEAIVEKGLTGELTNQDVVRLCGMGPFSMASLHTRGPYTSLVSWSLYTTEYLDSLERLLRGKRVLEVCSGTGVLGRHMRERGISWRATDLEPLNEDVWQCDALAAVHIFEPDVIFASWIPYGSDLDQALAEIGIPLVLLGESEGGCTGTQAFWQQSRKSYISWETQEEVENEGIQWDITSVEDLFEWFQDVPQFSGLNDYTSLVLPAGSTFTVEDQKLSGPPV